MFGLWSSIVCFISVVTAAGGSCCIIVYDVVSILYEGVFDNISSYVAKEFEIEISGTGCMESGNMNELSVIIE